MSKDMVFKNFCIVMIGKTDGALTEIALVADNKPKVLDGTGILISTFNSVADAKELEDYFISLNRSFFLFEVGADNSGYNIIKEKIHQGLFGEIELEGENLEDKSNRLMDEINKSVKFKSKSGTTEEDIPVIEVKKESKKVESRVKINNAYYDGLSEKQKNELINEILDKGYDNLNNVDREILELLTKED